MLDGTAGQCGMLTRGAGPASNAPAELGAVVPAAGLTADRLLLAVARCPAIRDGQAAGR
jgi:hypothetical protein